MYLPVNSADNKKLIAGTPAGEPLNRTYVSKEQFAVAGCYAVKLGTIANAIMAAEVGPMIV